MVEENLAAAQESVLTGEIALAMGIRASGIGFIAAVPALPGNGLVAHLIESGAYSADQILYFSNGRNALEAAIAATLSGNPAAVSVRGSEFAAIVDILASLPLHQWPGGLVIFVADDPGAWFSLNLLDSRALSAGIQIPVLEAIDLQAAAKCAYRALQISVDHRLPVVIRYTAGFALENFDPIPLPAKRKVVDFASDLGNFFLENGEILKRSIDWQKRFDRLREKSGGRNANPITGDGEKGILAVGFVARKVREVVDFDEYPFRMLALENVVPVPQPRLQKLLKGLNQLLILEEGEPVVERQVRNFAQQKMLQLNIAGKLDDTVPLSGELLRWQIEDILAQWHPDFTGKEFFFPSQEQIDRFSLEGFCHGCDYKGIFKILNGILREEGLNEQTLFVGTPGCTGRILQQSVPGHRLIFSPGPGLGLAASLAQFHRQKRVIAVTGDTALYHSGLNGLIDAINHAANLFVLVLDNGISAQTGLQPNAGSGKNAFGEEASRVPLEDLLLATETKTTVVAGNEPDKLRAAMTSLLRGEGVRVLIVKLPCYFEQEIE